MKIKTKKYLEDLKRAERRGYMRGCEDTHKWYFKREREKKAEERLSQMEQGIAEIRKELSSHIASYEAAAETGEG